MGGLKGNKRKIDHIKGKISQVGLSFLGELQREERKKKRREEEEEEGEEQRYGSLGFCMEKLWILVWNVWNLCMELWMGVYVFVWENQTINPFLMNLGLKEP